MNTRISVEIPLSQLTRLAADYITSRLRAEPDPEDLELEVFYPAGGDRFAVRASFNLPLDHDLAPDPSSNPHPQAD